MLKRWKGIGKCEVGTIQLKSGSQTISMRDTKGDRIEMGDVKKYEMIGGGA